MRVLLLLIGLIILTSVSGSCSLVSGPTDGIYLIPKGYSGDVIILFNQPGGVVPEVEDGLYVYRIPEGGVLKVQTRGVTGMVNKSYYYVDARNQRQRIKYLRVTGDRSPTGELQNPFGNITQEQYENTIYVMGAGGLGSFNTKRGVVQFTSFIIGTPKESERLHDKMQERITDIQREFIGQSNNSFNRSGSSSPFIENLDAIR